VRKRRTEKESKEKQADYRTDWAVWMITACTYTVIVKDTGARNKKKMASVLWMLTVVVVFPLWPSCHGYLTPTTVGKMLSSQEIVCRPFATTRTAFMCSVPETMTMTRLAADDNSNQVIQANNNSSNNNNSNNEDGDEKSDKRGKLDPADNNNEDGDEKSDKRGKLGRFWRRIKRLISTKTSDAVHDPPTPKINLQDGAAPSNINLQDGASTVGNVMASEKNNVASFQEDKTVTTVQLVELPSQSQQPEGTRWAISSNTTNLSGIWKPIVTPEFKQQYDEYLQNCSQPFWFRNLVSNVLGTTREQVWHEDNGRELVLSSKNPAGEWKRTLLASGSDLETCVFEPVYATFQDPDKDLVRVESWWEKQGTVHKSILRGKPRLLGGEFETLRYLEANADSARDDIFVCESYFHPSPTKTTNGQEFRPAYVKWRYKRV
jgi:hypothetical protein